MAISYDPSLLGNEHPTQQGYSEDASGTDAQHTSVAQNGLLMIFVSDAHLFFFRNEQDLPNRDIEVEASIRISQLSGPSTPDTGVHFELYEGTKNDESDGYHLIVACFQENNIPKMGIALSSGTYGATFDVNWTQQQSFSFGIRQGQAFLKINGQTQYVNLFHLPTAGGQSRFAFGCFAEDKNVTAYFGKIAEAAQTYPIAVRTMNMQLFPQWIRLIELTTEITLDPSSPGFDPVADGIGVTLSFTGGNQYYPLRYNPPIHMTPTPDGWRISDAQRSATGVEVLRLCRTPTPGKFVLILADLQTDLAAGNYRQTTITIESGRNRGSQSLTLQGGGNWYHYP